MEHPSEVEKMGNEIDFLKVIPTASRDYAARSREKTPENIAAAKKFGVEFFDGPRNQGYGGYKYDGRWKTVAERIIHHYQLPETAAILDVGCAKGFLLHEFRLLLPKCTVAGVDISQYALDNSMSSVKPFLRHASADLLPYADKSFDLVLSINSIHNLPIERCRKALSEIQRVSRKNAFVTVDAWHNDAEHKKLLMWILTAETYMHVDDWKKLFSEIGYTGDYHWFIAN